MLSNQKIKDGLYYTINPLFTKVDNNSFLKRHPKGISLSFQFTGLDCGLTFADTLVAHEIEFVFHREYLDDFSAQQSFNVNQFADNQQHEVCCNTQMILHEIVNNKLQGAFGNMFLESKALSLLLCFQKCSVANAMDCASCKFLAKPIEKEKILKAKKIILSRLADPLTLSELSLEVGTNQCYLKKGFKELFGITVYEFIHEQRMLKAKMLLTTTDFSVAQVADEIGLASSSHFSSAFKKFAGILPSELQQN